MASGEKAEGKYAVMKRRVFRFSFRSIWLNPDWGFRLIAQDAVRKDDPVAHC
jgi:hypothetical protein